MDIDSASKIAQIGFYVGGLVVAVLTYRRAKSTILNTVNTEYHKKVIESVAALSDELYREFDFYSDAAWHKQNDVKEMVARLNEELLENKDEFVKTGELSSGIPVSSKQMQLSNLLQKYKSDPFLPESVRAKTVGLLKKRTEVMLHAQIEVLQKYVEDLAKGKHWDTLETNHHWIHNQINERLYKGGVGVSQVGEAVHEVRLEIQRYFQRFNPVA
ncbi:hypothetical protein LMG26690_04968 [Achromobacter animicus]|uniref:Uncharacterized protein n=1 Tax=Achromobacter animicus TaxID=1389935 RepID=A0A6S7BYG4_9BURK|nr:hypothetical protein [Achromobacter animicus]CAB3732841.1 hypothetical protein LMG26690_04968 [Achromobacter animicus]